ncbi:MAG TPA: PEGA domain-containing protein [Polyangium sp.]|nr:PEGA domain-containing protein [Polyangium sp.]
MRRGDTLGDRYELDHPITRSVQAFLPVPNGGNSMKNHNLIFKRMLMVTLLLGASPTWAQEPPGNPAADTAPAPADARKAEAERLLKEGVEAAKAENWSLAHERFTQAAQIDPEPFTIMQLGRTELKLGNAPLAAEYLEYYLLENSVAEGKKRNAQIEEAVRKLFEEAKAKSTAIRLTLHPAGAEVYVDGERVDDKRLPGRIYVAPGSHKLEAKQNGFDVAVEQIEAVAGTEIERELQWTPQSRPLTNAPVPQRNDRSWMKSTAIIAGGLFLIGIEATLAENAAYLSNVEGLPKDEYERRDNMRLGFTYTAVAAYVGAAVAGAFTLKYALAGENQAREVKGPPKATVRVVPTLGGVVVQGNWF